MSVQHALLTSLLEQPSSGYDLARRFDRSIGYFWQATHQQIYRELGRMAEAGWVAAEDDEEGAGRRKKVYHVLPAGRAELARWVLEPAAPGEGRRALLVKLRAEAAIGPLGLDQEMERQIAEHRATLELYLAIEQRDFSAPDLSVPQRLQHAVLRSGILGEQVWLQWAHEVLPLLRRAAPQEGGAA
ncbi:PadR family transcriptional regulator [Cupriavidus sp. USMAA2-4]|uniref:PadR family transcriptional regulator n=1 Tax=Cupriavidus malaysiensis TaxID=367825 RepID=A0ABN4TUU0_9BURK|nr:MULTISPECIES: PadR family transcriptional regulator [Cupriavidus]AOY97247.1 PadR family transcriptional regulator [Cupriavidus sp. USMAA2-4]AOZ04136.1 PadR family transcriptional regulator [Cupriavidus sp. USMAHM13]AOZ10788.1 PadR family transcriptional regulator [Cupriavidus malaysiensis]